MSEPRSLWLWQEASGPSHVDLSTELLPPEQVTESRAPATVAWMSSLQVQRTGGGGVVAQSCPTLATPQTPAYQAPLSMGFSRQEYWSGLPFPSPGDLPNPCFEPRPPASQADSLLTEL